VRRRRRRRRRKRMTSKRMHGSVYHVRFSGGIGFLAM
jgi:hypothetical protein